MGSRITDTVYIHTLNDVYAYTSLGVLYIYRASELRYTSIKVRSIWSPTRTYIHDTVTEQPRPW